MNSKTEVSDIVKSTINRVVYRALTEFLKRTMGGSEYQGYCWIPTNDLEEVYQMLSRASEIQHFSDENEDLVAQYNDGDIVSIAHVRVFAILHNGEGRHVEVSGTLVLFVLGDKDVAYILGGTAEHAPLTIKLVASRFQQWKGLSACLMEDLVLVFGVPDRYGNNFVQFRTRGEICEEKTVAKHEAEDNVRSILQSNVVQEGAAIGGEPN